jgi:hypothetical protein
MIGKLIIIFVCFTKNSTMESVDYSQLKLSKFQYSSQMVTSWGETEWSRAYFSKNPLKQLTKIADTICNTYVPNQKEYCDVRYELSYKLLLQKFKYINISDTNVGDEVDKWEELTDMIIEDDQERDTWMKWVQICWYVTENNLSMVKTLLAKYENEFLPSARNVHILTWCTTVEMIQIIMSHPSMQKQLQSQSLNQIVNANGWFLFLVSEQMLQWWLDQGVDTSFFYKCVKTSTYEHKNTPKPRIQRIETVFAHREKIRKVLSKMFVSLKKIEKSQVEMILDFL